MSAGREFLSGHRLFHTVSVDEARANVAEKFCDHRLEPSGSDPIAVRHNHVAGSRVSLNFMTYGGDVTIDPGALQSFYLVQVPLSGHARITHRGTEVLASERTATVLNPDRETRMFWSGDCAKLLLQIDKAHLEDAARILIGRDIPGPIRFRPDMDLEAGGGRVIRRLIAASTRAAEAGDIFGSRLTPRDHRIETDLAFALLSHHPSNISHMISRAGRDILPRDIRRAVDFIHSNLVEPVDLAQIAAAAGVSVRTLQTGFRAKFGLTPMQYLKNARLDMAHYLLAGKSDPVSVTDAAFSSGFSHLGRFSRDYKLRFGMSPSRQSRQ